MSSHPNPTSDNQASQTDPPRLPTPPRTVRVLTRGNACLSCRRRKQRCDGTRPVCQQCIRFNRVRECVFEERAKTREEMLLDRIRELEAEVERVQMSQGGSVENASVGRSEVGPEEGGSVKVYDQNRGLPRPDIALVSTHDGGSSAPIVDPPKELTDHL